MSARKSGLALGFALGLALIAACAVCGITLLFTGAQPCLAAGDMPPPAGGEAPGNMSGVGDVAGPATWGQAATGAILPGLVILLGYLLGALMRTAQPLPVVNRAGVSVPFSPAPATAASAYPAVDSARASPDADQLTAARNAFARRQLAAWKSSPRYGSDPLFRSIVDRVGGEGFGQDRNVDWRHFWSMVTDFPDELLLDEGSAGDLSLSGELMHTAGKNVITTVDKLREGAYAAGAEAGLVREVKYCARCGWGVRPRDRFCMHCGAGVNIQR